MSIYKRKFNYFKENTFFDNLLNSFIFISIINWIMQGMRGMQTKELLFRICLEIFSVILIFNLTNLNLIYIFIIIHTVFWLFNSHFWVIMRYSSLYSNDTNHLEKISNQIVDKIQKVNSRINIYVVSGIRYRSLFGSLKLFFLLHFSWSHHWI